MSQNYLIIDDEDKLTRLCQQLNGSDWLAIDTEFEREKTYYPELCLLQIATQDLTAIIDPLAINNLEAIYELFYDRSIIKVFHSARQDLEIFFHLKGEVPVPIFDTQLAAATLGFDSSIGYANLVEKTLGVKLDKTYTRTNWKYRPLKPEQLRYAADDVIYLAEIYQQFAKNLIGHEKFKSLHEEFAKLADPQLYVPQPESMWKKIKEARHFKGNELKLIKNLAAWRELTARQENLPRKWLLSDRAIIDISRASQNAEIDLSSVKSIDTNVLKKHCSALLRLIQSIRQNTCSDTEILPADEVSFDQ